MSADNTELIREAKREAIVEAQVAISKLLKDLDELEGKSGKNQPTRRKALNDALQVVANARRPYWNQQEIDRFNAMHNAYHNGGSSRGAAFVSADMKPDKL